MHAFYQRGGKMHRSGDRPGDWKLIRRACQWVSQAAIPWRVQSGNLQSWFLMRLRTLPGERPGLDDPVVFDVRLPPGAGIGPVIDREALRAAGRVSAHQATWSPAVTSHYRVTLPQSIGRGGARLSSIRVPLRARSARGQPCHKPAPTVSLRGANRVPSGGQPYHFARVSPLFAVKIGAPDPDLDRGGGGETLARSRLAATAPRLPNKLNHHESVANRTCLGSGCVASSDPRRFVRSSSCFVTRGALRIIINTYWNHRF